MSKTHDEIVRVETIAVLDAIEVALAGFLETFQEVAGGTPLDPQHAENLAAKCATLFTSIVEIRNTLRLSADGSSVH